MAGMAYFPFYNLQDYTDERKELLITHATLWNIGTGDFRFKCKIKFPLNWVASFYIFASRQSETLDDAPMFQINVSDENSYFRAFDTLNSLSLGTRAEIAGQTFDFDCYRTDGVLYINVDDTPSTSASFTTDLTSTEAQAQSYGWSMGVNSGSSYLTSYGFLSDVQFFKGETLELDIPLHEDFVDYSSNAETVTNSNDRVEIHDVTYFRENICIGDTGSGWTGDKVSFQMGGGEWEYAGSSAFNRVGYINTSYLWKMGMGYYYFLSEPIPSGSVIVNAYLNTSPVYAYLPDSVDYTNRFKTKIVGYKDPTPELFVEGDATSYTERRGTVVGGSSDDYITSQFKWDSAGLIHENEWVRTPNFKDVVQEIALLGEVENLIIFHDDHDDRCTHIDPNSMYCSSILTLEYREVNPSAAHTVTYNANGGSGSVPVDSNTYADLASVTLASGSGLTKTGYNFIGWSNFANGDGIVRAAGSTYNTISGDVTFYAVWTPPAPSGITMSDYMLVADVGIWYEILHATSAVVGAGDVTIGGFTKLGCGIRFAFDAPIVQDTVITSAKISVTPASIGLPIGGSGTKSKIFLGLDRNAPAFVEGQFATQYQPICGTIVGGATDDYRTPEELDISWDDQEMTVGESVESPELSTLFNYLVSLGDLNSIIVFWQDHEGLSTTNKFYVGIPTVQLVLTTEAPPSTYAVTYDGNGNTGGTVPTDTSSPYEPSASVTVLDNTGSLTKTSYEWTCWNTTSAGDGTDYNPSDTFVITGNTTLYAKWELRYMVTYDGNGNTGGTVPTDSTLYEIGDTATVLGNTGSLVKTGYRWLCWNTAADGSGTDYDAAETFIIPSNVTLYAKWIQTFTVIYNGNGSDGGTVPVDGNSPYDTGSTVTVLGNTGNLINSDYTFAGWKINKTGRNYKAGKTFTIISSVTLYAVWASSVTRIKKQMGL